METVHRQETKRVALCLGLLVSAIGLAFGAEPDDQRPFHKLRDRGSQFAGTDGNTVNAVEVQEVRIAYFGPSDEQDPVAGDMWRAARSVITDANRQGGFHGKPFRLVPIWSKDPWGTGVARLTRAVYEDKVWAIVGGIDGPSTHLAEQVVAKARLPLISPVSTDKTANLANVPWLFSLAPGDHLIAPALAAEIDRDTGGRDWILVSSDDHDSHLLTVELKKTLSRRHSSPRFHFVFRQSDPKTAALVTRAVDAHPAAIAVLANVDDTARLVRSLRSGGYRGALFGGPSMGRRRFVELAGDDAEGVVFPLLSGAVRDRATLGDVTKKAEAAGICRPQTVPKGAAEWDDAAALTYDAVRLTVDAIRRAGLNRACIREAIRGLDPWTGIAGTVRWDALGANTRPARLATIVDGRVQLKKLAR